MGLSCYEHDAEAIRDFLMATNEDYDIKDALIALTSIVAGLQNQPKSEGDSQNVNQQLKVKMIQSLWNGENDNLTCKEFRLKYPEFESLSTI